MPYEKLWTDLHANTHHAQMDQLDQEYEESVALARAAFGQGAGHYRPRVWPRNATGASPVFCR